MGKIAFVFSGQGDQYSGMGKELYDTYPAARAIFEKGDSLRPKTSDMCFFSSTDILSMTENTQPCLFTLEAAIAAVLSELGIRAEMAAGFSLGEMAALTYAGTFHFDTGFSLTCRRAERMGIAASENPASMAAVLRLPAEKVRALCSEFQAVYPVNFNCPNQVSVSAKKEDMAAFCEAVKAAGGKCVPLKVSGGFHSPFMNDASVSFSRDLAQSVFFAPEIPVYSNVTALPYEKDIAPQLAKQISSPVLWDESIKRMIADGADTFIEIGPGKTLCNLITKTDASVRVFATGRVENIQKIKAEVAAC